MNQKQITQYSFIDVFDFFLLLLIEIYNILFFISGTGNFITNTFQIVLVALAIFYCGQLIIIYQSHPSLLLKKACFYYILFLIHGAMYDLLGLQKRVLQSISDMITTVKIPYYSEIFFTVALVLLCSAFLSRYISKIADKKWLLITLSIAGLFVTYCPSELIGYPLIGAFISCQVYKCVAILPALCYFCVGIHSRVSTHFSIKKWGIISLITSIISVPAYLTPLKNLARYTIVAFPVFIIYCLINHFIVKHEGMFSKTFVTTKKQNILYTLFVKSDRKHLYIYFLTYTVFFLATSFFVFSVFRENNLSVVWFPDAVSQYIPKAYYFSSYIRECVSQIMQGNFDIPHYDFNLGMGGRIAHSYEPLYYIFALFKPENIESAYNIVFLIRYFFVGISVSIMLLYFNRSYYQCLFGSIMYTFCGFSIAEGVRHAHFIAPMIFLPLMIVATEEIIRQKRWYIMPPVIAIALLNSYYFIYINTIIIGLYYLARFIFKKENDIKTFVRTTIVFGSSYILGVIIGNLTLATTFASYLGSNRSEGDIIATPSLLFYNKTWFKRCLATFISLPDSPGYIMRFGFVPLAAIAIIILFMRKGKKTFKTLFITFSVFCMFPFAGYVFSGFSAVNNRWCYAYALLITAITIYMLPKLSELNKRELKILFLSILPYIIFIMIDREFRTMSTITACALLLMNYLIILFMNSDINIISKQTGKIALLMLCIISVCLNSFYQYSWGSDTMPVNFVTRGEVLNEIRDTSLVALEEIDDDSFYRASSSKINTAQLNASRVIEHNSISEFSSTINGQVMDFSNVMGNIASSSVRLKSFDNRTFLNSLACVKYFTSDTNPTRILPYGYELMDQKTVNGKAYTVYENTYALPLGYTYDNTITESELLTHNAISRQELIMQSVVLNDDSSVTNFVTPENSIQNTAKEIAITGYEADGLTIVDQSTVHLTQGTGTLKLYFESLDNAEIYLEYIGKLITRDNQRDETIYVTIDTDTTSNKHPILPVNNAYTTGQKEYIYNLGYHKDKITSCTLTFTTTDLEVSPEEPHIFSFDSFKIFCQPMDNYPSYIDNLKENCLENIEISNDKVSGNITVDKNKILVLSIPYEKGWTAYVDGQETKIEKANLMYMGIPLNAGEHSIELVYEVPGLQISHMIAFAGILIYIFALFITKKHNKNNKQ